MSTLGFAVIIGGVFFILVIILTIVIACRFRCCCFRPVVGAAGSAAGTVIVAPPGGDFMRQSSQQQHREPLLQLQEQPWGGMRSGFAPLAPPPPPPLAPPPPPLPLMPMPTPGTAAGSSPRAQSSPRAAVQPAVFLSHAWSQQVFVQRIARYLTSRGVTYWLDREQMAAGGPLMEKITQGLHASTVVLVVLSKDYLNSENCNSELQLARNYKKPLVVVKLEGVDCPPAPDAGKYAAAMAPIVAGEMWLGVDTEETVPEQELMRALKGNGVAVKE